MDTEELHYPPGAEPEQPQEQETPRAETTPEAPAAEEAPETSAEPETPAETPEQEPEQGEQAPAQNLNKPRTLLEAKQQEKQRRKEAEAELANERSARQAAEARNAELEKLLQRGERAQTPADKAAIDEDLRAFADEQGLDPEGLLKITNFLSKRIGGEKIPADVQKELDELKEFKNQSQAERQRMEEDRAIDAQSPAVKTQLKELGFEVHVQAEADKVMAEVKRLAHTPEFADKPVEYIVWANREKLSKMISPKRSSFEQPSPATTEPSASEVDFSKGGLTPEAAAAAALADRPGSGMTFK